MFGRRPTATSRWLPRDELVRATSLERDAHAGAVGRDARIAHTEVELHPFALENLAHLCGHFFIFARDQAVGVFEHCDFGPETPVHLRELEADVAAADDDQVRRQEVDRHHRRVGQHRHAVQPRPIGQRRAPADVDENLRRLQSASVDLDGVRADESRVAEHDLDALMHM